MSLTRICQRELDTAEAHETVRVAARRMASRAVGMLLVLDAEKRPLGLVTDRDIATRVVGEGHDPATLTVGDIMTRSPKTVSEPASVEDALSIMRTHGVRRLPVVTPHGAVVGVITLDDVLAQISEELWQMARVIRKSSPQSLVGP